MKGFGWFRGHRRRKGVEKPCCRKGRSPSQAWLETRNFLYYDGREMPEVKERNYGKNK